MRFRSKSPPSSSVIFNNSHIKYCWITAEFLNSKIWETLFSGLFKRVSRRDLFLLFLIFNFNLVEECFEWIPPFYLSCGTDPSHEDSIFTSKNHIFFIFWAVINIHTYIDREMKRLFGSPGRKSGLILRIGQCMSAAVSIGVMASAHGFSSTTAFW